MGTPGTLTHDLPGRLDLLPGAVRGGHRCGGGRAREPPAAGRTGRPPPPRPGRVLTVAVREAREALGARVAPLPREVRPAVAAARQVLTRPVGEVRLAVAGWGVGSHEPPAQGYRGPRAGRSPVAHPIWAARGGPGPGPQRGVKDPGMREPQTPRQPGRPALTAAGARRVQGLVRVAVEAGQAALAVDAGGVVLRGAGPLSPRSSPRPAPPWPRPPDLAAPAHLAVDAHAPALVDVVAVLAGAAPVHLGVVVAVVRVAVAVAGCREGHSVWRGPQGCIPQTTDDPRCGLAQAAEGACCLSVPAARVWAPYECGVYYVRVCIYMHVSTVCASHECARVSTCAGVSPGQACGHARACACRA